MPGAVKTKMRVSPAPSLSSGLRGSVLVAPTGMKSRRRRSCSASLSAAMYLAVARAAEVCVAQHHQALSVLLVKLGESAPCWAFADDHHT